MLRFLRKIYGNTNNITDYMSRGQGKMLGKDCLRADQDLNIPCYVTIDT
jgi:hypothetical protein